MAYWRSQHANLVLFVSQKEKRNGRYLSQIVTLFSNLLFR